MTSSRLVPKFSNRVHGFSLAMKGHSLCNLVAWQSRQVLDRFPLLSHGVSLSSNNLFGRPNRPMRHLSTPSATRTKKQALDRDVIVSVLEASATRRDAKGYLQKYASQPSEASVVPADSAGDNPDVTARHGIQEPVNVAIVKLRLPQTLSSESLYGVAKTLSQLRVLGLIALVVVDCGVEAERQVFDDEALRLSEAIDSFGGPGAKLADHVFVRRQAGEILSQGSTCSDTVRVEDHGVVREALRRSKIVVMPSVARQDDISARKTSEGNETTLALTKYLSGLQLQILNKNVLDELTQDPRPAKIADVERIILLDPVGGTPMARRPDVSHRFINLEQEYGALVEHLVGGTSVRDAQSSMATKEGERHAANLGLAKDALSFLPPTSSALITTPLAVANITPNPDTRSSIGSTGDSLFGFDDMVTTRKQKNLLLHNLLTDRPSFSPSLPLQRLQDGKNGSLQNAYSGSATLIKRGMPITIYPDPRAHPWCPPRPGSPRLRLTDNCIDLPRLVHLIENSFGRKLDVQDYLDRVNENLAGIIIAGEYEGGAILTWERPEGIHEKEAFENGHYVPYLDKFAVLKSRQGSSGVADIVFNAMVQDCFPGGVCWRSRKDNPVNKWYFERSTGTCKLSTSNWTMFWTTSGLGTQDLTLQNYESVCRGVQPSWADNKHVLD